MRFIETELAGAYMIELESHHDARGFFARTFCVDEFRQRGLSTDVVQCNISVNTISGTLRGMHYQRAPHAETKLVRCSRGAIYDVIVDVRPDSPTYGRWIGEALTAENGRMLYVPKGFAHGFQTLAPDTEVCYQMDQAYVPSASVGFRYDDPLIGIHWPQEVTAISDRDRELPCWQEHAE